MKEKNPGLGMRILAGLMPLTMLVGCATDDDPLSDVTVRDSAGVEIVEYSYEAVHAVPEWMVEAEPEVMIGEVEGDPAYLFSRLNGVARLESGTIVVTDRDTNQVRFFDSDGVHLVSAGGSGNGPGEFRFVTSVHRGWADSVLVEDAVSYSIRQFGPDGGFAGEVTLGSSAGAGRQANLVSIVGMRIGYLGRISSAAEPNQGIIRYDDTYLLFGPDGTLLERLIAVPGAEFETVDLDGRGFVQQTSAGRRSFGDSSGRYGLIGSSDENTLHQFDFETGERRIIRIERGGAAAAPEEASVEPGNPHSNPPVFDEVHGATAGVFWIRLALRDDVEAPRTWLIMDRTGRVNAHIEIPERLEIMDIGPDWVLGIVTDDLDVERVALYRIVTTPS